MPFAGFKNFKTCVSSVSKRKNPPRDPKAYCAWLKRKIEGGWWAFEKLLGKGLLMENMLYLMTKAKANTVLDRPGRLKEDNDAVVIDDHRWVHVWANAIKDGKDLFLTKDQVRKLHDILVDEMARRGMDAGFRHKTPIKFEAVMLGSKLEAIVAHRKAFRLDPAFINYVGGSVLGKKDADVDTLWKISRVAEYKKRFLETIPPDLHDGIDFVWEPAGPHGLYIPGYELWAIPVKNPKILEPKYNIQPLSPMIPAAVSELILDPRELLEDSYFVEPSSGLRTMIHRKESVIIAFDKNLEEIDLPEAVAEELLRVEDPRAFILDGFLTRENGQPIFRMLDMPWWRMSEHIWFSAEARRHFLNKIPESDHVKRSKSMYFPNRRDTIAFLKEEKGPYLLIPGLSIYPIDGSSQWLMYEEAPKELKLQEGSDAQIKNLVNSGEWESKSASERFKLMTKRKRIEPLYPFAQLKTTKKGYAAREVFGLKSVEDLAKDLFRVPNKQAVEVKIDGFRVQAHKKGDQVRLYTESGHEITKQIPGVAESAKKLPAKSFVLDTEATPYDEKLNNLGRAGAAPAFAKGAKGPVDDSRWALHVFDILSIDGEEIHKLPYEERRERLRGLELPIRDVPKSDKDFRVQLWENHVHWATSGEQMVKFAGDVSKVLGSEGAMFKQADSKYRLSGNTPLWSKMKVSFEIDAMVVGINREGNVYNYVGVIGPVDAEADATAPLDGPKGKKFVKYKGKVYSILGKTFNTKIKADIGDIIRVTVKNVRKIDEKVYHWFHPQVLEKREDKTKPDPLKTAETIHKTATPQKAIAYLVSGRFEEGSPLACCEAPWIAISGDEWIYLGNTEEVCTELHSLGVKTLVGTGISRERLIKLGECILFEHTKAETIQEYHGSPLLFEDPDLPEQTIMVPEELKEFYDRVRPMPHECLKLSCGGLVPLEKLLKLADLFRTYPDEDKKWRWSIQFHARGLGVHGDLRIQVSPSQAIGWTWNIGKSLLKPMLKRTPREQRVKAGISQSDFNLPTSELSAKLKSTKEGKALYNALRKKTQDLEFKTLKAMMDELWKEQMDPILENPTQKILTQIKHPMSVEWLDYEREVPAGAVGATTELEGQFVIMDKGTAEYGAQKPYFHEYWLDGERIKDRRVVVRRLATRPKWRLKEAFAWMTFFSKPGELPYTISKRAVTRGWMPPKKVSAIPASVRAQIPKDRQYWRAKNAKEIRDELVSDIKARKVTLRMAQRLQFSVKRVWHKGPEVRRGLPVTRYWILIHSGRKVYDAWDFGKDSDPLEEDGLLVRRRKTSGMNQLLKTTGKVSPRHPVSQTRKLKTHFDTSDHGAASITAETDNQLRVRLKGETLKGEYVFVKESGEMWTFKRVEISEEKKTMLLAAAQCETVCPTTGVLHLAAQDMKTERMGDLLIISGPAIKPGEVLPMDGRPTYFTKEGIEKLWPSMWRQPIVVLHGDLKGDVIGFVDKIHYDKQTGWGWVDRAVIWHPVGIKLVLEKKLPSFSIEVIPKTVWDAEHKHEHIIGGNCVGLALVPKGACLTCNPITAQMGTIKVGPGKVYKFGMTTEEYLAAQYWGKGHSTQALSEEMHVPRSTIESWMKNAHIPRRSYKEAWEIRKLAARAFITALGTGAFTDIPRDDCPQCKEARAGGKSRRNFTSSLFSMGNEHLLIDTPKGIASMLGLKRLKPKYVLIEHIHEDVLGGLHELRPLKPIVFATKEIWAWLRRHYRGVSGKKDIEFDKLYDFERRVLSDKPVKIGPFAVKPVKIRHAKKGDPSAIGYKIGIGGKVVWHGSDVYSIPNVNEVLKDVDIYIGDGASFRREITRQPGQGHTSMEKQLKWTKQAGVSNVYFTQIGHVGKTHEQLNKDLQELAPNAQALHDGQEIRIRPGNPGARFETKVARDIASGERKIIVRTKPYQEYPKQAIYLLGEDDIQALYVEGFPQGPLPSEKVRIEMRKLHGFTDKEWKAKFGDTKMVYIYWPRILKRYPDPNLYNIPEFIVGPYVHNVRLAS